MPEPLTLTLALALPDPNPNPNQAAPFGYLVEAAGGKTSDGVTGGSVPKP